LEKIKINEEKGAEEKLLEKEKSEILSGEQKENLEREKEEREKLEKEEREKLEKEENLALKNKWRSMKFEANFKINDLQDRYILSANIPRMKEEDIKITLGPNNETITISGYREPIGTELQQMRKQLTTERKRDIKGKYYPPHEDEVQHLLRLGAGRFGQFSETYQIDPDRVKVNEIQASYQGGVLQIVIPKKTNMNYLRQPQSFYGTKRPRNFFMDNPDFFW